MPSTYSPLLRLELMATGEKSATWGDITNTNLGTLLEKSISGTASVDVTAGNATLTALNGTDDEARCAVINVTGTPSVSRNVVAPSSSKTYCVLNGSNAAIVFKGAATAGVTLAAGQRAWLAWNGSDFVLIGVPTDAPTFTGTATFAGSLTVNGNTILGDAPADTLTIRPNAVTWSNNPTHSGNHTFSGSVTAAGFSGPLTGNASTATALQTARTINGVSFNGTANITVAAAAGTLTGSTLAAGVTGSSLTSLGTLTSLNVTGSVGIGTATPYAKVSIIGTAGLHIHTADANTGAYIESLGDTEASLAGGADYNSFSSPNYVYTARSTSASGYRTSGGGSYWWGNSGLTPGNTFNATVLMSLTSTGLGVGAGVTPGAKLDVGATGDTAAVMARFFSGGFGTFVEHTASFTRIYGNSASRGFAIGTNSTDRLVVTTDGRIYGTALHNNAGAVTGTTNQYIASGTYTPTITQGINCSGGTPSVNGTFKWCRVGNVVHLSGWLGSTGAFTSASTYSELLLTLPIASAFTAQSDASGLCAFSNSANAGGQGDYVYADTGGDRLVVSFYPNTTSGGLLFVEATYEVL